MLPPYITPIPFVHRVCSEFLRLHTVTLLLCLVTLFLVARVVPFLFGIKFYWIDLPTFRMDWLPSVLLTVVAVLWSLSSSSLLSATTALSATIGSLVGSSPSVSSTRDGSSILGYWCCCFCLLLIHFIWQYLRWMYYYRLLSVSCRGGAAVLRLHWWIFKLSQNKIHKIFGFANKKWYTMDKEQTRIVVALILLIKY